jgi:hypothetical protein
MRKKQKMAISLVSVLFCILAFTFAYGVDNPPQAPQTKQPFAFTKNQEIQQVKPKKPVKIKLHRAAKGDYTWDISGDNVDDLVRADARLRKQLKLE